MWGSTTPCSYIFLNLLQFLYQLHYLEEKGFQRRSKKILISLYIKPGKWVSDLALIGHGSFFFFLNKKFIRFGTHRPWLFCGVFFWIIIFSFFWFFIFFFYFFIFYFFIFVIFIFFDQQRWAIILIYWYCYNQKQSSGGVLLIAVSIESNFAKFTRKHLR